MDQSVVIGPPLTAHVRNETQLPYLTFGSGGTVIQTIMMV